MWAVEAVPPSRRQRRAAIYLNDEDYHMAVTSAPTRAAAESEQAARTIEPRSAPLAGFSGTRRVPPPTNEPVKSYAPGSPERAALKTRLAEMAGERAEIPIIIGGEDIR